MRDYDSGSKEYEPMMDYLERLYKLKALDKQERISPDTIAIVAGNLLGIGLILNHERLGHITSKALGFVIRGRV